MNRWQFGILAGLILIVGLAGWLGTATSAAEADQAPKVQKWEYKVIRIGRVPSERTFADTSQEQLNKLGDEGWELITSDNNVPGALYIFKRPKN